MSEPAERTYDEGMDDGATFVLQALAKALELDTYTLHDGTETWEGDVLATLYGILHGASVIDEETGEVARVPAPSPFNRG